MGEWAVTDAPNLYTAPTQVLYGDNSPEGTRIVFINGDIDPFHAGEG